MIALDSLRKEYGRTVAADSVNLRVAEGAIFGFLGANGAGKTTTLRMLCGLTKPTSGRGTIGGLDIWRDRQRIREKFGYMAQRFSLYADLTVEENLRFFGGAYRVPREVLEPRIGELIALTDLGAHREKRAAHLSGGLRQLLALACALVHDPALLFLDEPTAGLDPTHRHQLWNLLYDLSTAGKTIVVTTHYMDEAERCTEVSFMQSGHLLVQDTPRALKNSFREPLLDLHVTPTMPALAALRTAPGVLGASMRSDRIRLYTPHARALLAEWEKAWPFPELALHGTTWVEPDMEDVFSAYTQGFTPPAKMNPLLSFRAIGAVARKEFLHVWRDRRVLVLILILPPFFTLLFGYAFAHVSLTKVPAVLYDLDHTPQSAQLVAKLQAGDTFAWKSAPADQKEPSEDLLALGVNAAITIPPGWGKGITEGSPIGLQLTADGTDSNTQPAIEGLLKQTLGQFQTERQQALIDDLPDNIFDLAKQLPPALRSQFASMMNPWPVASTVLYNPKLSFIDYVTPGIIGLILQLLTVTLMALTLTRERDNGTLAQLMVTSLRQREVILGKMLTYLVISIFLISTTIAVAAFHFKVEFHHPVTLALTCLLFLISSLALGLLLSAISQTQTQAIQFAVFYLLPVFPLSGAFASLSSLPSGVRLISELFPLTHFCRAFRAIDLQNAPWSYFGGDLAFLLLSSIACCVLAGLFLQRAQD